MEDGLRVLRVRYRRPRLRPLALVCQTIGMLAAAAPPAPEGWRPDVVHAHVYSAALPALLIGRAVRVPVVVTEHYTGFGRGLITGSERRLARFAFEHADLIAPVSHELAATLRQVAPRARMRGGAQHGGHERVRPARRRGRRRARRPRCSTWPRWPRRRATPTCSRRWPSCRARS